MQNKWGNKSVFLSPLSFLSKTSKLKTNLNPGCFTFKERVRTTLPVLVSRVEIPMYLSTRVWSPTPEWQSLLSVPVGRLDVVWADFSSQVGPSNLGSPKDEVAEDLSVSLGPCAEAVPSFVERFQCWELDPPPPFLESFRFPLFFLMKPKAASL